MSRSSTVTIFRGIFLGGFLIFGVSPLSREGELRSPSPAEAPPASALASPRDSLAISCATAIPTSRLIVSVSTRDHLRGVNTPSVGTGGAPPPCAWSISISCGDRMARSRSLTSTPARPRAHTHTHPLDRGLSDHTRGNTQTPAARRRLAQGRAHHHYHRRRLRCCVKPYRELKQIYSSFHGTVYIARASPKPEKERRRAGSYNT
ncbi:unnamed protein product [Trichogramma brassicae]|uniref:Uncharacterized protein n=1 Tax=Trichogramma brassicae TaxID=86971 RepID=A0A6H5J1B3_9HYME|nr:unnamed protein product [Trichogramma brassicae]